MAKTIYAKDPEKFISALAEALKKIPEFQIPEWALFVKSGVSRERPPVGSNFWYIRAASILRQLYIKGVLGVGRIRTRYGSRKDMGGRPDKFVKAGGKIIRVILQQAESAGLVEKVNKMQHGRRLTIKGRDFLDSIEVEEKTGFNLDNVKISPSEITNEDSSLEEINEEVEEEKDGK
jgi:small subunit ribosomal protein S19e